MLKLADVLDYIIEEFDHLTEMRENDNFDNPFVLSFLSNYIIPNHFIPDNYLFKFEISRIKFATTGFTHLKMSTKVTEMLAASFLLIRIFVDKMLLHADILMLKPGQKLSLRAYENLKVISAIFYHTFKDLYGGLEVFSNNLEVIELTEKPRMRLRPMKFGISYSFFNYI